MSFSLKCSDLLLGPKILYLLMCLPYYVFYTFRPIYLEEQLDITNKEYGTIASLISITATFGPIFWTNLADRLKRHRLIIQITAIGNCLFLLAFIPVTKHTHNKFLITAALVLVDLFFQYGMQPLLDARVMQMLKVRFNDEAKAMFGRQRVWGSIGYIVSTNIVGALIKLNYSYLFYLSGITTLFYIVGTFFLIPSDQPHAQSNSTPMADPKQNEKYSEKKNSTSVTLPDTETEVTSTWTKYKILLTNGNYLFFLLVTFCNGFSRGVGSHYLPTFSKNCIKNDPSIVNLQATSGTIFEIVLFFFSKQIVNTIGVYWMLIIAQLTMALRMTFYALMPLHNPDYMYPSLAVELLKGVSMACMTIPGVQIATSSAPAGLEATALGLFISIFVGVSPAFAALTGGFTNEKLGRQAIFRVSAVLSVVALVIFFIKYYFFDKKISFRRNS